MRLCCFGDSFVNGTNDPECLGWAGRIVVAAKRSGTEITVYNLGIRRDTSAEIRVRWRAEAERRLPPDQPGRLLFSFGVNDSVIENGIRRVSPTQSLENAEAILAAASTWQPTLMVGPPPIADPTTNLAIVATSTALEHLCHRLGVPYLPTCGPLLASRTWMTEVAAGDGAHPGAAGYQVLADLVAAWPAWRDWFPDLM